MVREELGRLRWPIIFHGLLKEELAAASLLRGSVTLSSECLASMEISQFHRIHLHSLRALTAFINRMKSFYLLLFDNISFVDQKIVGQSGLDHHTYDEAMKASLNQFEHSFLHYMELLNFSVKCAIEHAVKGFSLIPVPDWEQMLLLMFDAAVSLLDIYEEKKSIYLRCCSYRTVASYIQAQTHSWKKEVSYTVAQCHRAVHVYPAMKEEVFFSLYRLKKGGAVWEQNETLFPQEDQAEPAKQKEASNLNQNAAKPSIFLKKKP